MYSIHSHSPHAMDYFMAGAHMIVAAVMLAAIAALVLDLVSHGIGYNLFTDAFSEVLAFSPAAIGALGAIAMFAIAGCYRLKQIKETMTKEVNKPTDIYKDDF